MEEIKNFTISYDGVFWLRYDKYKFMIYLTPRQLAILFTQEGIDMNEGNGRFRMEYQFNKAILIVDNSSISTGDLFDKENKEIGLVLCYAKVD